MWDLVPSPGTEAVASAVEVRSLHHWTMRAVPELFAQNKIHTSKLFGVTVRKECKACTLLEISIYHENISSVISHDLKTNENFR